MFYGVDTSCYTTSLAVVDGQGRLLCEQRKLLTVSAGERGLRQSDGVFLHMQNLPELAEALLREVGPLTVQAVAASTRPRPVDGSYMPVFNLGAAFGRTLSATLGVPFRGLSHQEGHLLAGLWSAGVDWDDFYAVHLSGGTTELLAVQKCAAGFEITALGGSEDLHAGQFIDRVGVALGLPFPAGPALEKLAAEAGENRLDVPVSVRGLSVSFSGPESHVQRTIAAGSHRPSFVARGVEQCVAASVLKLITSGIKSHGYKPVLLVGGVMANRYIRTFLSAGLGSGAAFAEAKFAGDNAVGAALFAQKFTYWKTSKIVTFRSEKKGNPSGFVE